MYPVDDRSGLARGLHGEDVEKLVLEIPGLVCSETGQRGGDGGGFYPSRGDILEVNCVGKPSSLADAAGVLYKIGDAARGIEACFECHSTGPVSFDSEGQPKITERGVRCEACHGGAAKHVSDPKSNPMPVLRDMQGAAMNELCGRCHRPPASKRGTIDWNYAWNVRHQPVYLNESRCFQKSAGALSCVNCHNPHEQGMGQSLGSYNRVCQSCHTKTVRKPKASCFTENQGNCVDCHMPLVSPQPALRFTNHWIGRYTGGSRLRPVR